MNKKRLPKKWNGVNLEEEEEKEKKLWMQKVTTGMREKGIKNMEWIDREEWGRKINVQAQKDVKTAILCTYEYIKIHFIL